MARGFTLTQPYGSGQGFQEVVYKTNPATGAALTHSFGGNYHSRIVSVLATYAAAGGGSTRIPRLQILDANGVLLTETVCGAGLGSGSTRTLVATNALTNTFAYGGGMLEWPSPSVFCQPGWTLQLTSDNLGASDTFTACVLIFDRYPTGPALVEDEVHNELAWRHHVLKTLRRIAGDIEE